MTKLITDSKNMSSKELSETTLYKLCIKLHGKIQQKILSDIIITVNYIIDHKILQKCLKRILIKSEQFYVFRKLSSLIERMKRLF